LGGGRHAAPNGCGSSLADDASLYGDGIALAVQLLWTFRGRFVRLPPPRKYQRRLQTAGPRLHFPRIMIRRLMLRAEELVRRALLRQACLPAMFFLLSLAGCTSTPPAEPTAHDPLAEWTSRARPESENDRAAGWSDKARETERRLGFR
jgi:hypothetical protein